MLASSCVYVYVVCVSERECVCVCVCACVGGCACIDSMATIHRFQISEQDHETTAVPHLRCAASIAKKAKSLTEIRVLGVHILHANMLSKSR